MRRESRTDHTQGFAAATAVTGSSGRIRVFSVAFFLLWAAVLLLVSIGTRRALHATQHRRHLHRSAHLHDRERFGLLGELVRDRRRGQTLGRTQQRASWLRWRCRLLGTARPRPPSSTTWVLATSRPATSTRAGACSTSPTPTMPRSSRSTRRLTSGAEVDSFFFSDEDSSPTDIEVVDSNTIFLSDSVLKQVLRVDLADPDASLRVQHPGCRPLRRARHRRR